MDSSEGEEEPGQPSTEAREARQGPQREERGGEIVAAGTHLGIDIRVKGAVLFECFDLKSILQKGEEKKM